MQVSKDGYEERTLTLNSSINAGWAFFDVVFGLIPIAVDAVTSNWETFERSLNFRLVRISNVAVPAVATSGAVPPDEVAVATVDVAPPFDPNEPRSGVLRILNRELVAFPLDGGTIRAKIRIRWNVKNVELGFGEGLHVGDEPFGSFPKDRIVLLEGSDAYVQTTRGRVVHIHVASLDHEAVELEWADQSRGKVPTDAVVIDQPAPVDSTGPLGGMLYLQDDEPVEFPVDGGVLLVKTHHKEVELRLSEGLHVGYERAGPFSTNRITLAVGSDAYVLTRRSRLVYVRCTSLEAGEAVIEWMRK